MLKLVWDCCGADAGCCFCTSVGYFKELLKFGHRDTERHYPAILLIGDSPSHYRLRIQFGSEPHRFVAVSVFVIRANFGWYISLPKPKDDKTMVKQCLCWYTGKQCLMWWQWNCVGVECWCDEAPNTLGKNYILRLTKDSRRTRLSQIDSNWISSLRH